MSGEKDSDFFTEVDDFGVDIFGYDDRARCAFVLLGFKAEPGLLGDFDATGCKLLRVDWLVFGLETDFLAFCDWLESLGGADFGRGLCRDSSDGVSVAVRALRAHAKHLALGRSFQEKSCSVCSDAV